MILMIKYTGINAYAYKGLNCNVITTVVTGNKITVNIGPIVCAKKYSNVSISPTAMLITSPIFWSIKYAGANRLIDVNKSTRILARIPYAPRCENTPSRYLHNAIKRPHNNIMHA